MSLKNAVFPELARLGKALSSPLRLEILDWLCQRDFSVEELASTIGGSVAVVSHHLQILKSAHLVNSQSIRQRRLYRIAPTALPLWQALMSAGNVGFAEVREAMANLMRDPNGFTMASPAQLRRLVKAGRVLLIDVRPVEEYESGHFPGAISVPMVELDSRLRSLPRNLEIIAYCRGPYCILSHDVVRRLQERGYRARRWPSGVADWTSAGIRSERGMPRPASRIPLQ